MLLICVILLTFIARARASHAPVCVLESYPHNALSFTQGLAIEDGLMYESTGLYGRSAIMQIDINTGIALRSVALNQDEFGEGMCIFNHTLIQLTWKNRMAYAYDTSLNRIASFITCDREGWGITHDYHHIITSNGTSTLAFYHPSTHALVRELNVDRELVLNELEYVDGMILANVWHSNAIVVIDPSNGVVLHSLDASLLHPRRTREMSLNGIAFDVASRRLYVTGKLWSRLYEVEWNYDRVARRFADASCCAAILPRQ